ncbi:MAG: hypothetical protein ABIE22_01665 [archaeon]
MVWQIYLEGSKEKGYTVLEWGQYWLVKFYIEKAELSNQYGMFKVDRNRKPYFLCTTESLEKANKKIYQLALEHTKKRVLRLRKRGNDVLFKDNTKN